MATWKGAIIMINWYKDKSDSSTIWPYDIIEKGLQLNGRLGVKRSRSTEENIDIEPDTTKIDLNRLLNPSLLKTWDKLSFNLQVQIFDQDENIEDYCENVDDVDVLVVVGSTKSRYQNSEKSGLSLPVNHIEIELDRQNIYGEIKIQAFYILNCDYEENDYNAYKKGSVIAYSDPITVIADYIADPFGGQIKESFKKFEGENKNALYQFKFDEDEYPQIIYNSRFSNFTNLIRTKTPAGHPKTLLRDFLVSFFVSQIYYDLSLRLPKDADDVLVDSVEYNAAKSLGKIFKKQRLTDILGQFSTTEFLVDDENSSVFQHALKLGPILDTALDLMREEE